MSRDGPEQPSHLQERGEGRALVQHEGEVLALPPQLDLCAEQAPQAASPVGVQRDLEREAGGHTHQEIRGEGDEEGREEERELVEPELMRVSELRRRGNKPAAWYPMLPFASA